MSNEDPYQPPTAPVGDAGPGVTRWLLLALIALQVFLVIFNLPDWLERTNSGDIRPLALLGGVLGTASLAVGGVLSTWRARGAVALRIAFLATAVALLVFGHPLLVTGTVIALVAAALAPRRRARSAG